MQLYYFIRKKQTLVVCDQFLYLFHQLRYLGVVFGVFTSVIKGVVPGGLKNKTFLKGHSY